MSRSTCILSGLPVVCVDCVFPLSASLETAKLLTMDFQIFQQHYKIENLSISQSLLSAFKTRVPGSSLTVFVFSPSALSEVVSPRSYLRLSPVVDCIRPGPSLAALSSSMCPMELAFETHSLRTLVTLTWRMLHLGQFE